MRFGKLPEDVMRAKVSMGAKVLYAALAMHRNGRTLQCNPSQAQLAETMGVTPNHINTLAKELDRAGLVQRVIFPGRQTTYTLPHLQADFEVATTQQQDGATPQQQARTTTQQQDGGLPNNRPGHPPTIGQESLKIGRAHV